MRGAPLRIAAQAALALTLAAALVGTGYLACTAPAVTPALSSALAWDDLSPFSKAQLSRVASATRDFSFGSHDETTLYRTIYQVNRELQSDPAGTSRASGAAKGAPDLDGLSDESDAAAFASAFSEAGDAYVFDRAAIEHLDDVNRVATAALPVLAACVVAAIGAAAALVRTGGKRTLAVPLIASSALVIGSFSVLGLWAAIDFTGMFDAFHSLFFTRGTWEFSANSLLICALPTELWMSLGAIWLAVTSLASVLACRTGIRLLKEAPQR